MTLWVMLFWYDSQLVLFFLVCVVAGLTVAILVSEFVGVNDMVVYNGSVAFVKLKLGGDVESVI